MYGMEELSTTEMVEVNGGGMISEGLLAIWNFINKLAQVVIGLIDDAV